MKQKVGEENLAFIEIRMVQTVGLPEVKVIPCVQDAHTEFPLCIPQYRAAEIVRGRTLPGPQSFLRLSSLGQAAALILLAAAAGAWIISSRFHGETCRHVPRTLTRVERKSNRLKAKTGSAHFVLEDAPVLHHKPHSFQFTDILQRVTGNRDDIRVGSGRDHTELTLHVEQFRCA